MEQIITRAALGRTAYLGHLYDSRTDSFCGMSVFNDNIPTDACSVLDAHSSDIHLIHSDSYNEKFSNMDINAELSVSVLAGLCKLEGSGRYLGKNKTSSRTVTSSLLYKIRTQDEKLNIYDTDLTDIYCHEAIRNRRATHVVTGISWGANSVVSCLYEKSESQDEKRIQGSLSAYLNKIKFSIQGQASVDYGDGENDENMRFEVRIFGDILPRHGELPTTFEGALQLMSQLPQLVGDCNDGKGKPLSYQLIPISMLQDYLNIDTIEDLYSPVNDASLMRVVRIFDEIATAQQEFAEFYEYIKAHNYCIEAEDMKEIRNFKNKMAIEESDLRSKLSSILTEIRSGERSTDEMEDFMEDISASEISPENVASVIQTWKSGIRKKISFADLLIEKGAIYIGRMKSLEDEQSRNANSKSYALFFNKDSYRDSCWSSNRQLFFAEMEKHKNSCKFYALDCDIHKDLLPEGESSCVRVYHGEECIQENLLEDPTRMRDVGKWVKASNGDLPNGALLGGRCYYGEDLYVARANYKSATIPGKLVQKQSGVYFPWDCGESFSYDYEVLVVPEDEVSWEYASGGDIPSNAVLGGESDDGEKLYIGRARHDGTLQPGKVHPSHGKCYICYYRSEYAYHEYEILVKKRNY